METIALRLAASPRHVAPLPPSGEVGDGPYQFLGDYPTAVPVDQLPAGRCWWLCGGRSWTKNVSPRLAGAATARVDPSGVLTLPAWVRLVPLLATCRRLYKVASQAVTGVDLEFEKDSFAAVFALRRMSSLRTILASDASFCHRDCCASGVQRDDKGVPLCDAAASQEDAFLLHHALRWCRPNAIAYRGFLFLESCYARCPQREWSRCDGWCFNR